MLNFDLKHSHNRTWHKKFPRQKIEKEDPKHLGMTTHLRLRNEWREGRKGYLSTNEIDRFIEVNLGKNVDKVFSEFVKRAKRYPHDDSLRERFFDRLDSYKRWNSGYVIDKQNKIIRVKESYKDKIITNREAFAYNEVHYPQSVRPYLKSNTVTYFGSFYLRTSNWNWIKTPVYICSKEWYDTVMTLGVGKQYLKMSNMRRVIIPFTKDNAVGIPEEGYATKYILTGHIIQTSFGDYEKQEKKQFPYTTLSDEADYIFLVKEEEGIKWNMYYYR